MLHGCLQSRYGEKSLPKAITNCLVHARVPPDRLTSLDGAQRRSRGSDLEQLVRGHAIHATTKLVLTGQLPRLSRQPQTEPAATRRAAMRTLPGLLSRDGRLGPPILC